MAALTRNAIRLGSLVVGAALALAAPARAGDVSVQLDAGAGFSVDNSSGAIERLRVDEATGNVSRNGALFVHTTGTNNTFVGAGAGNTSTTGAGGNSALGASALLSITSGASNSALGVDALRANTTGTYNSAVGRGAMRSNLSGSYNSAVGGNALFYNTTGFSNAAFGTTALLSNTVGNYNAAFGTNALRSNTSGVRNSAVGYGALRSSISVNDNSAVGYDALFSNTTGSRNSAVGSYALHSNTSGSNNSAVGTNALRANTSGIRNVAVGYRALRYNNGNDNSAFGGHALGYSTAGQFNIAIGSFAGASQTTGSSNIYLANAGVAGESGQIKIGTAGSQTRAFVAGIRGVTTVNANAVPVLIDSAGQLGTASSSSRVKREIRDMGATSARLLELRPVTFRYEPRQTLPSGGEPPPEYGLIAEEVAEVLPDLVVYDEEGLPFTVKYHVLAPMLLNEMQKQQRTIEALTTRLARLEQRSREARR